MRARDRLLGGLAIVMVAQLSCAEIPTAPRHVVTIQGTILTRDGDPVADAGVLFEEPQGSGDAHVYGVTTGSDGSLSLRLAEGTYDVHLFPSNFSGLPEAEVSEFRVAGENPRFDYKYGGIRIEGTVLDPHGAPFPFVDISFDSPDRPVYVSYREYDGHYRVYLPPGDYDYGAAPVSLTSGVPTRHFRSAHFASDTTCDIALTGRRITGRATGPDGAPLPGVSILYRGDEAAARVDSRADGSYELYVPDGSYLISAFPSLSELYIQARPFGRVLVSGDLGRDLPFVGVWWQGTVRSPEDGSPVAGAEVRADLLDFASSARSARAVTDANGTYRLSVVSPAWHFIRIGAAGRNSPYSDPIPAGADSTLDFVAGTLYGSSVTPVPRGARAAAR